MSRDEPFIPNRIDALIGARVGARRDELGISVKAFAEQLGASDAQVQRYEEGFDRIEASLLFSMSKILDVSVAYFFDTLSPLANDNSSATTTQDASISEGAGTLLRYFSAIESAELRQAVIAVAKAFANKAPSI